MPVPPTWIPRLAEILGAVQKLPSRDLDREQIMRLFRVKRRAALLLMKQLEEQNNDIETLEAYVTAGGPG